MLEQNVNEILIRKGKVVLIGFSFEDYQKNNYVANIAENNIEIPGIVNYNLDKGEALWNLEHCCGGAGFGGSLEDECCACTHNGKSNDFLIAQKSGKIGAHYLQDFLNLVSLEIPKYCSTIEKKFEKD